MYATRMLWITPFCLHGCPRNAAKTGLCTQHTAAYEPQSAAEPSLCTQRTAANEGENSRRPRTASHDSIGCDQRWQIACTLACTPSDGAAPAVEGTPGAVDEHPGAAERSNLAARVYQDAAAATGDRATGRAARWFLTAHSARTRWPPRSHTHGFQRAAGDSAGTTVSSFATVDDSLDATGRITTCNDSESR
jgi:hypothetical protein